LREVGSEVPVYGPARLGFDRFLEEAGEAAEGVVVATTLDPSSTAARWQEFQQRFQEKYGEMPDAPAAHGYDGMNMLIEAIDRAGLNRVRIRNELAAMLEYEGVSGRIVLDNTFNDVGAVYLGRVEEGRFVFREAAGPAVSDGAKVIGLLRPLEGEAALFADGVEEGIRLALAESGRLLTLEVEGTRGAWTTVGEVARDLIADRHAAGLVTALDPQGAHVAAQVATRLRRPIAVAGESPKLLAHTGVPWILTPEVSLEGSDSRLSADRNVAVSSGYQAARRLLEQLDH